MAEDVKPGVKTSEFWLSLLAVMLGAFISSGMLPESHVALKIAGVALSALAAFGYTISRGSAKGPGGAALALLLICALSMSSCASVAKQVQVSAQDKIKEVATQLEASFHAKCSKIAADCGKAGDQECKEWIACNELRVMSLAALKMTRHALIEVEK